MRPPRAKAGPRLRAAPTPEELERLYHELGRLGARAEGRSAPWRYGAPEPEELIVLASQASRYDPRVLWIVVEWLARSYDRLDPLVLRRALEHSRWPAALGVAFEFARRARPSAELSDVADFVMKRVGPASGERYFVTSRAFAGGEARRDAEESLAEYRRWGFLAREEPLAKELGLVARGTLGPAERRNLLLRLARRRGELTLSDYLEALEGRASRRQAERDLASATFLRRVGRTRGARWRLDERSGAAAAPRGIKAAGPPPPAPPPGPRPRR